ncbi:MAG: metallophosphoesterase [Anaerolineales bacterium]
MLVVISDLHLGDGSTASSIPANAFHLFANRLRETAYFASFRKDGTYKPIETLDLLLMGDVLDPLHSTLWLDTAPSALEYTRPWTSITAPLFPAKLAQTTQAILDENKESLEVLRRFASGELINLPPANMQGRPDHSTQERIKVKVRIFYMIGNHDWYFHLKGPAFDNIRRNIINSLGLCNPVDNFPFDVSEYPELNEMLAQYKVYARHGDCFDHFNFNPKEGRDYSALGDVFTMEVLNRYPVAVQQHFGNALPVGLIDSLRKLTNVRPALATPLWISGQLKRYAGNAALESDLKKVWDKVCDEFLQLPVVRAQDKPFVLDTVDAMEIAIKIAKGTSFETLNDLVYWIRNKVSNGERSFAEHALEEPAFLNKSAKYILYGHTHHHEVISLNSDDQLFEVQDQIYFNTGTWHTYFDLATKDPKQQKFIPYQTLTYLAFYKDGEREGRQFETWSGTYA